ncbi:hypothetical protein ES702_03888 [subsurface metagenome]
MKWKQKAKIQNLIAKLPPSLSYKVYHFLQRKFGALQHLNPTSRLSAGITTLNHICGQGRNIDSKTFLEIGTGRRLCLPIALWLCGVSKIITVDLNPYLKEELVFEDISYMRNNQRDIEILFGKYSEKPIFRERFNRLLRAGINLKRLIDTMNVQYLAPADACCLDLQSQSVDYCVSRSVFEHIPPKTLEGILLEEKRLLKKTGLFVHEIDLSDHFLQTDKSISVINFLQFNESEWEYYAGNRYAYHNRLRIDDFIDLFNKLGLRILFLETNVGQGALEELRKGFPLDDKFKNKSAKTNATTKVLIVASLDESA